MSLSGFMKQINKANQLLSEKIGGAKGTEFDGDFTVMEKKTDVIYRLVDDIRDKTNEYLQPNPASRAKLWTVNNLSKMRGQVKNTPYPQPEGTLGEAMTKYGKDLGDDSNFGMALCDMGESLRQMAGIKYALEDNIKQNFLDPLAQIKDNDLKEVMHLRKKTENRRLDYDCKKRKKATQGSTVADEEVAQAAEKFEETKAQTEACMNRLLGNEVEHITHLVGFAEGFLEYHHQCYEILKDMLKQLNERKKAISAMGGNGKTDNMKPYGGYGGAGASAKAIAAAGAGSEGSSSASRFYDNGGDTSSSLSDNFYGDHGAATSHHQNGKTASGATKTTANTSRNGSGSSQPCAKALYDFEAENAEELEFKEGDLIKLVSRLDDNWLQGEVNGRQGRFPVSYVDILVPIP